MARQDESAAAAQPPPAQPAAASATARAWEAAVGRGEDCLRANARRYKVKARNPARAALSTLRRHGITIAEAQAGNLHLAIYDPEAPNRPRAVYAVAGRDEAPELQLRYARLHSPETPLHRRGGPLDRQALARAMPGAARFRAEEQLGTRGLRDVLDERFWEREISLYTGTALVLAAFGFPMSLGVFVVGGVILLLQGGMKVLRNELRLRLARRRIARDESLQPVLHTAAIRRLFAEGLNIAPDKLDSRLGATVLSGQVVVPDISGGYRIHLYIDENAAVAVGGLRPARLDAAMPAEEPEVVAEHLTMSENVLTVVFRKPKQARRPATADSDAAPTPPSQQDAKVDLDDLGRQSRRPSKVDFDEIGRKRPRRTPPTPPTGSSVARRDTRTPAKPTTPATADLDDMAEVEDAEVVEAEVIDPDGTRKDPGAGHS